MDAKTQTISKYCIVLFPVWVLEVRWKLEGLDDSCSSGATLPVPSTNKHHKLFSVVSYFDRDYWTGKSQHKADGSVICVT